MRRIGIKAICHGRETVDFTFGMRMPLSKVMQAYADYFEIDRHSLCFRVHGIKIKDSDTAARLKIRKGHYIRVTNVESEKEDDSEDVE